MEPPCLGLMVEIERGEDEHKGGTEVDIGLEIKDENREDGGDEHRARDEEETRDVARVLHHRRHYQTNHRLAATLTRLQVNLRTTSEISVQFQRHCPELNKKWRCAIQLVQIDAT